ncbi:hypothetical protein DFP73DRAFT_530522 [Morchella snyderi]|nr:hypothetical protein DFP73DRAFT_530522 [Morchella snyderi]
MNPSSSIWQYRPAQCTAPTSDVVNIVGYRGHSDHLGKCRQTYTYLDPRPIWILEKDAGASTNGPWADVLSQGGKELNREARIFGSQLRREAQDTTHDEEKPPTAKRWRFEDANKIAADTPCSLPVRLAAGAGRGAKYRRGTGLGELINGGPPCVQWTLDIRIRPGFGNCIFSITIARADCIANEAGLGTITTWYTHSKYTLNSAYIT